MSGKKAVVHLHIGILLGHKKKEILPLDSIDGPGAFYANRNKTVRERQIPYDFTYMWDLMNNVS